MSIEKLLKLSSDGLQIKYYLNGDCFCGKPKNPTLYNLENAVIHLYCENCFDIVNAAGYNYTPLSPKEIFTIKIFLDKN